MTSEVGQVAVIQMNANAAVERNLAIVTRLVARAADQGAKLIVLPENFAYLGPDEQRTRVAECVSEQGPILSHCRALARAYACELILGSLPESIENSTQTHNTCVHLAADGSIKATYRKIHLFDVDLPDGLHIRESNATVAGRTVVVTQTAFGSLGLSICYDLRFPEMYRQLIDQGAVMLAVPAAFTQVTGRAHWEILLRARAIESQAYVLAAAQIGEHFSGRSSFGHSMIVDPWGEVLARCEGQEAVALANIDLHRVQSVRKQLPCLKHRYFS